VGRTLLSAAFDFGLRTQVRTKFKIKINIKNNTNAKGCGQECPPHTLWNKPPLVDLLGDARGDQKVTSWQVRDAKARFGEFLDASIKKGPQVVTRRGVKTAVLVSIEEWERLQKAAPLSLKDWLLAPEPRFDIVLPKRGTFRSRPIVEFE
jgi:antitoxin Phd